jgi:hypothetical protein
MVALTPGERWDLQCAETALQERAQELSATLPDSSPLGAALLLDALAESGWRGRTTSELRAWARGFSRDVLLEGRLTRRLHEEVTAALLAVNRDAGEPILTADERAIVVARLRGILPAHRDHRNLIFSSVAHSCVVLWALQRIAPDLAVELGLLQTLLDACAAPGPMNDVDAAVFLGRALNEFSESDEDARERLMRALEERISRRDDPSEANVCALDALGELSLEPETQQKWFAAAKQTLLPLRDLPPDAGATSAVHVAALIRCLARLRRLAAGIEVAEMEKAAADASFGLRLGGLSLAALCCVMGAWGVRGAGVAAVPVLAWLRSRGAPWPFLDLLALASCVELLVVLASLAVLAAGHLVWRPVGSRAYLTERLRHWTWKLHGWCWASVLVTTLVGLIISRALTGP